jgi:anti-anti-sigma regulatory factor
MSFRGAIGLYIVDCDVSHLRRADLTTVNALARAALNARRLGTRIRFTNASPALQELIAFVGLDEALLGRPGRQAEEREQRRRVEEELHARDPPGADLDHL